MMYAEMLYEIFIDILHITFKANYYVILYIEYNFIFHSASRNSNNIFVRCKQWMTKPSV